MTDMGDRISIKVSRLLNLLMFLFFIVSCYGTEDGMNNFVFDQNSIIKNDSIEVVVNNLPGKQFAAITFYDDNLKAISLEFFNHEETVKSIRKKILVKDFNYLFFSFRGFSLINKVHKSYSHMYIFEQVKGRKIEFDYDNGNIVLRNSKNEISFKKVENIHKEYSLLSNELKSKKITKNAYGIEIEKLFKKNKATFTKNNDLTSLEFNKIVFLWSLSIVDPSNKRIFEYLSIIEKPIYCPALGLLLYNFVEHNFEVISKYETTRFENNSEFINLLSKELVNNLEKNKRKKNQTYDINLLWLKKTTYYQENKKEIDVRLNSENAQKSDLDILNFELTDAQKSNTTLKEIIKNSNAKYYLLDFWASWCAPCLRDFKILEEIKLPANLRVIKISLDKTKESEKWLQLSNRLNLKSSYIFVESQVNKNIIKQVKLQQIPRYILLNDKFEIINDDLMSPSEGDFRTLIYNLTNSN